MIPDSVTNIGPKAFYNCYALTDITIGRGVTIIDGGEVFYNCAAITSITVAEDNPSYKDIDGNLYTKDGKTIIKYAVGRTNTTFTVPDSVTVIADYAFRGCSYLTDVVFSDGLTEIGNGAFSDCTALTSVVVTNQVKTIDSHAFSGCSALTTVVIGNRVERIESRAFSDCTALTSVKFRGTEMRWYDVVKITGWDDNTGKYTVTYNYWS